MGLPNGRTDTDQDVNSWKTFTERTTLHGVRYTGKQLTNKRRALWIIAMLIGIGYFILAASLFLKDYSRQLVSTKIKVKNTNKLQFPTVTICNRNYWKKSRTTPAGMSEESRDAVTRVLKDLYLGAQLPPPPDKYNWSDPKYYGLSKDTGVSPEVRERETQNLAHTLNETFSYCYVMNNLEPCSKILQPVKTDAGFCHQFNGNGLLYTHTPGLSGGFRVLMNAKVDEYFIGPASYAEGFSVAVHDTHEVPLLLELSSGVKPGELTHFTVQRKEIKRVPPYADAGQADCFDVDNLENPLHYYPVYSYSACKSECKVIHLINRCGCKDVFDPPLNGSRSCYMQEMLECSAPATNEFHKNPLFLRQCNCRPACYEVRYTAKLSTNTYPSENMVETIGCNSECFKYARKNFAMLHVLYGEMSYDLLEEEVTYSGYDFIANLGGTLGLCVGASFLTIIEFIEFGFIRLSLMLQKRKKVHHAVFFVHNQK